MTHVVDPEERHVQALIRTLRHALTDARSTDVVGSIAGAAVGVDSALRQANQPLLEPAEALRLKYPDQPHGAIGRRFALLGLRPTLVTKSDACAHCREYRGLRRNPLDAPLLPLEHCASPHGCRCHYR